MKPSLTVKFGQPSWRIATPEVEAFVTETGGQVGPVTFRVKGKAIQPFSVAPWAEEPVAPTLPPMLEVLRGDFFCLPFGGNATPYRGERHPPHGETANRRWKLESHAPERLHLSLRTRTRKGLVDKFVVLRADQSAIYERHVVSGMTGPMSFGHHAMLKLPDNEGSGRISTNPFRQGWVVPESLEKPEARGYSCLRPGAAFKSMERVPTQTGNYTDLSRYPARRGFEDLVLLVSDERLPLVWTAVTFPAEGYVWFALKDPRVLRQTILWLSNGGRHYPPWNGRHTNVLGLEEVTSYFHYGLAESVSKNPLSAKGSTTCLRLDPMRPLVVNYIIAVAPIPRGFDCVARIVPAADAQSVRLASRTGRAISVALDVGFLGVEN
ncbi:MAG: hypothetical protein C5B50_20030 [Verrucomicrobia bacterium]|nr:MAG: hypothetical protein C5B50_20030 [Verrucomicrobiota bacterium]